MNIPLDELRGRIDELPHDKDIYIYCAIGLRGYLALKILMGHGFNRVKNLSGGYKTYVTATAPIVNTMAPVDTCCTTGVDTRRVDGQVKTVRIDACGLQCPGLMPGSRVMRRRGVIQLATDWYTNQKIKGNIQWS